MVQNSQLDPMTITFMSIVPMITPSWVFARSTTLLLSQSIGARMEVS